ncbi:MAG: hypothetical protein CFE24_14980 [Flavobacterium sp. BFFFF2]|nr:MAG: hypothetical protein CFE24_14980 [Flavobacterium sp. BFFFF2]
MTNIITEIDLIDFICEFIEMTPEESEWSEEKQKSNPPRLIRLKRINALLKAYMGNEIGLSEFISGDFVSLTPLDKFNQLRGHIEIYNKINGHHYDTNHRFYHADVSLIFKSIFKYKQKMESIFSHNCGWLIASGNLLEYYLHVISKINKSIKNEMEELNQVFKLIINPGNLTFSLIDLIENYGYPEDDLSEIDFEWL